MKKSLNFHISKILLFLFGLFYLVLGYSAEQSVSDLQGAVTTDGFVTNINVVLMEKDNTILDVTNVRADGTFTVDAGVLDDPTFEEVKKLYLQLERGDSKKKIRLLDYIKKMSNTVYLRAIPFP